MATKCLSNYQIIIYLHFIIHAINIWITYSAVVPPPWANPKLNPCASQPRGWQLLYWPPDGRCYKIFQIGYPCPEGMELSPAPVTSKQQEFSAECRCPPKTAQSARDGKCYELFTLGPCQKGYYFAPDTQFTINNKSKRHWGVCKQVSKCYNKNDIFWPQNGRCYARLTRGPCARGQLITLGNDKLAVCKCSYRYEMKEYWFKGSGCYQHFTKGPCKEKGHLFLPDRSCGCHSYLPHYHKETQLCFEIGTIGPCATGEHFQLDPFTEKGICQCKNGYIRYQNNSFCYRPYTQGPCNTGNILINTTTCIKQPCAKNQLYFPEQNRCYRVGSKGPCVKGKVVTYDLETRPSIDGISYNGICNCEKNFNANCEESDLNMCEKNSDMVVYENKCYKLYTQGPCAKGAWLTLQRRKKQEQFWSENERYNKGLCECMPGYTKTIQTLSDNKNITECLSPTVILAEYLNKNYFSVGQITSN